MDKLKIYIDRLSEGQILEHDFEIPGSFLEVTESDLCFSSPISIHAKIYLADDHLIVNLDASTFANMPCAVCNKIISIPIQTDKAYLALPLEEIPHHIYNYGPFLRESLLLELPSFAECSGSCKERPTLTKFLKKGEEKSGVNHFPFSNLE